MPNLTKRFVDSLKVDPEGKDVTHWDDTLPGFMVRVKPSGAMSWAIQYRNKHGRLRKYTLGRVGVLTPAEAERMARKLLSEVEHGADPADDKRKALQGATVGELCDDYLNAGAGRIKASTLKMDRSRIARHVKPLIGSRPVASLTPADIEKFIADIVAGKTAEAPPKGNGKRKRGGLAAGGAGVASRTAGMLGTILERAVRDGAIVKNPVRGIERPKDRGRKPPFSFERVEQLGNAMREAARAGENGTGLLAIRFLLASGFRRQEALGLEWEWTDQKAHCVRFPDTKSGAQVRPAGVGAFDVLTSAPRAKGAKFVFPGAGKTGRFVGLPKCWARVAERAGLMGVSLHGLRHWFASAAAEMNFSELTIAGLLGHKVKGVTARYATTPDSALVAAADRVSSRLLRVLDGLEPASAKVIAFEAARA